MDCVHEAKLYMQRLAAELGDSLVLPDLCRLTAEYAKSIDYAFEDKVLQRYARFEGLNETAMHTALFKELGEKEHTEPLFRKFLQDVDGVDRYMVGRGWDVRYCKEHARFRALMHRLYVTEDGSDCYRFDCWYSQPCQCGDPLTINQLESLE